MASRVLIVGGGIGGLCLGAALARNGRHHVEILERAPSWALVGAGIGIGINGMQALARLGLAEQVTARGQILDAWEIYAKDGAPLHRYDFAPIAARYGVSTVSIHRAALHEVLVKAAGGDAVRMGVSPTRIEQGDASVYVECSDGSQGHFDLVVGADGIRSTVRDLVFGPAALTYSGQTSFRCVVDRSPGIDSLIEIWGDRTRVGMSPISARETYCYTTLSIGPDEDQGPEGNFEVFRQEFAEFGGHFRHIYEKVTRPDQLIRTDISELIDHEWTRGRVVLIGDAAHALTPNLGQGGVMAIHDAAALADALSAHVETADALRAYVEDRAPLVRSTQVRSRVFGQLAHIAGETDLGAFRDTLIRDYGHEMMTRIVMGQYI